METDRERVTLGSRIVKARRRAGLAQADLAAALDKQRASISMVETGHRGLPPDSLAKAAKALEVSADYLLGLTDNPMPTTELSAQVAKAAKYVAARYALRDAVETIRTRVSGEDKERGQDILQSLLTALETADEALGDPELLFAAASVNDPNHSAADMEEPGDVDPEETLSRLDEVAATAGSGAEVYDETVMARVPFRRAWLRRHGINPRYCHIIGVRGDSMEPTLPNGCQVIVDHKRREPHEGLIYVMRTEEGLVVKRLGLDEKGRWEMLSDNSTNWEPALLTYGSEIIGEVRWSARTF